MPLSKETKDRIAQEANEAAVKTFKSLPIQAPATCVETIRYHMVTALEVEAERARILVECLNSVRAIGHPDKRVDYLIETTLDQYNNSK